MRYVTTEEMKALEKEAAEKYGIPEHILMENAGRATAEFVERLYGPPGRQALVVCGPGNNGGDGFTAARHLWNRGFAVNVAFFGDAKGLKPASAANLSIVRRMDLPYTANPGPDAVRRLLERADFVIDALFGTGLTRPLGAPYAEVIRLMNKSGRKVVSIDLPSGIDADSGDVRGEAVKAAHTVSLGYSKVGLMHNSGPKFSGLIVTGDISLPRPAGEPDASDAEAPARPTRRRRRGRRGGRGRRPAA